MTCVFMCAAGGFSIKELNNLELEFLLGINFVLSVKREDYESFLISCDIAVA